MIKQPAKSDSGAPNSGSFALVTYLPDPLGSFLTALRKSLPGATSPEAHITFLPPRPVSAPIESASAEIQQVLSTVQPFELELGDVSLFAETSMLYLSVEAGRKELLGLHAALNKGSLLAEEPFEYVPHLTLSGPLQNQEIGPVRSKAENAWATCAFSRRFVVNEVILLRQAGGVLGGNWNRVWSYSLGASENGLSSAAIRT